MAYELVVSVQVQLLPSLSTVISSSRDFTTPSLRSTSSPLRRSWQYTLLSQLLDISAIVIRPDSSHLHRLYYLALDICSQRSYIIGGLRLKKGVEDGPLKLWSWRSLCWG